ncbi:helix-turn-helix transcriptional regulator [Nocardiopsis kunsanensis]|uniref:helix-turn-helix transcriptional regulator n=1 Tax=Nocardiopsis kunsanensis TaxID=141693 RepID=UPI00034B2C42|nr:helix-turn-helix transcriptional regulator [Nocardiopsis kunsanensis]
MPEESTLTGWSKPGGPVRGIRLSKGLGQAAPATRAKGARSWLARVEAGHRGAEPELLLRLPAALDLTPVL